jgi:hypothetical protein
MLELLCIGAVLFVEVNGHGEALPERWVADACHGRSLDFMYHFVSWIGDGACVSRSQAREFEFRLWPKMN